MTQAVDNGARIIQPNVGLTGILEARKMAGIAQSRYAQMAPLMFAGPIAGAASIHLSACTPNFLMQEGIETWSGFHARLLEEPIEWDDGYLIPPEKPGLGIELDRDAFERYTDTYREEPDEYLQRD